MICRYWWLRVLSLGELQDWTELDQLSRVKKSPIGYEVTRRFAVIHCKLNGNKISIRFFSHSSTFVCNTKTEPKLTNISIALERRIK